jgi:hypothetical protein
MGQADRQTDRQAEKINNCTRASCLAAVARNRLDDGTA